MYRGGGGGGGSLIIVNPHLARELQVGLWGGG